MKETSNHVGENFRCTFIKVEREPAFVKDNRQFGVKNELVSVGIPKKETCLEGGGLPKHHNILGVRGRKATMRCPSMLYTGLLQTSVKLWIQI